MSSPGPIGGNTASSGVFTTLNATTITASNLNIANPPWANGIFSLLLIQNQLKALLITNLSVLQVLKTTLRSPPEIGSEDPNAATFTDLTVNTITINGTYLGHQLHLYLLVMMKLFNILLLIKYWLLVI